MDPFTIAAIIAAITSAAGTAYSARQNKKIAEGQAETERRERFRHAELQRQSDEEVRKQIAQFTPETQGKEIETAVAERSAAMAPAPAPAAYTPANVAAPVEVKSDLDRRLGGVQTKGAEEAQRRARLAAYGDVSMGQNFKINRAVEGVSRRRNESRSLGNIFGYEMREQANRGRSSANAAAIANTLGNVATIFSMGGRSAGAHTDTTASNIPNGPYPY